MPGGCPADVSAGRRLPCTSLGPLGHGTTHEVEPAHCTARVRSRRDRATLPARLADVEIRRAGAGDVDALRRLWDAFNQEATYTPYPANGFDPSLPTTYTALLAEQDRVPVGTAY